MIPLHASAPVEELRIEPYWPEHSELAQIESRRVEENQALQARFKAMSEQVRDNLAAYFRKRER